MKSCFLKIRCICLTLLLSCSLVSFSQDWEITHLDDCEQIVSAERFLNNKGPWIAVIGGFCPTEENYSQALKAGYLLAEQGYAVITGAGPGIMEAANAGAMLAGGTSLGIVLAGDELNNYIPEENYLQVSHICHRLHSMMILSSGCIAFPGGLGTMSELCFALDNFRYNEHCPPVVLVGKQFWNPLVTWMQNFYDSANYLKNLFLVDSAKEAVQIVTSYNKNMPFDFSSTNKTAASAPVFNE
ncbi:LOG family protein [Chlamydia vaughanii]|uniref:LOG family protein n=1 Tax=Chlamydia vaughanii TaxID=3112552 RepID=UPI0032B152C8